MIHKRINITLLVLLSLTAFSSAKPVERKAEFDWESGVLTITITAPLPESDAPLPQVKHQVLQMIQREFPGILRENLLPLTMDSFHTFGDAVHENPDLIHTVNKLAQNAILESSRMDIHLSSLILVYRVPLLPYLLEPFISDSNPTPLPGYMTYEPSASFTGIVIYAADPLPVYGERNDQGMVKIENLTPCFLPRIFNEEGREIFSSRNMDSEYLLYMGTAAYVETVDPSAYSDRAGEYPFYTTARGLFGKHYTDLILSEEDIRKFLSREENHRLLREGRIAIIY